MAYPKLLVNGIGRDVPDASAGKPLLWFLREDLGLTGTKFGCGAMQCGACTVMTLASTDGAHWTATRTCVSPKHRHAGQQRHPGSRPSSASPPRRRRRLNRADFPGGSNP